MNKNINLNIIRERFETISQFNSNKQINEAFISPRITKLVYGLPSETLDFFVKHFSHILQTNRDLFKMSYDELASYLSKLTPANTTNIDENFLKEVKEVRNLMLVKKEIEFMSRNLELNADQYKQLIDEINNKYVPIVARPHLDASFSDVGSRLLRHDLTKQKIKYIQKAFSQKFNFRIDPKDIAKGHDYFVNHDRKSFIAYFADILGTSVLALGVWAIFLDYYNNYEAKGETPTEMNQPSSPNDKTQPQRPGYPSYDDTEEDEEGNSPVPGSDVDDETYPDEDTPLETGTVVDIGASNTRIADIKRCLNIQPANSYYDPGLGDKIYNILGRTRIDLIKDYETLCNIGQNNQQRPTQPAQDTTYYTPEPRGYQLPPGIRIKQ